MHEHLEPKDCEHELKYCKKCDVVYCEKCKKEWKVETVYIYNGTTTITPPYYPSIIYPKNPWTTTITPPYYPSITYPKNPWTTYGTPLTTCNHK